MTSLLHASIVRRTVRALHLSSAARHVAYVAATRGEGCIRVRKSGCLTTFVTPTPEIWRAVDCTCAEPLLESLLAQIRDTDIFYDVGAHYGVYSACAARRGARVFAFEPNPACHPPFITNVNANRLESVITLATVALSDKKGTMMLHQGQGVGMLDAVAVDTYKGSSVPVSLVRADAYSTQRRWPAPTVLKIDVEGYESAVLDGFGTLLKDVRVLLCEVHPRRLLPHETPSAILRRITDAGLTISTSRHYQREQHVLALRH